MAINIEYYEGYAGTGKSTHLINHVKTLVEENKAFETICLFPTHKARERVAKNLPSTIECKTIHSIISFIPSINTEARKVEHIEVTRKYKPKDITGYKYIVLDEGGMLSEEMFLTLISIVEEASNFGNDYDVNIRVYLDTYQTLPVKGRQIQVDLDNYVEFTTQYRSESVDIVNTFTKFVHYLRGTNTKDLTVPYSANIVPFDISKFKEGDRLLAYTNKTVGHYNKVIASNLGINSYLHREVQLGSMTDTIIVDDYIEPTIDELLSMYEIGTLVMQNSTINPKFLESSLNELLRLEGVKFIVANDFVFPVIEGIYEYALLQEKIKNKCIENKTNFKYLYALNKAFVMDFTFASTVHKAQGMEFDTVFICKEDIQKSIFGGSYNNYARLMYVSLSRARKKVFI